MSKTKKYTSKEISNISKNFVYITRRLSLSKSQLAELQIISPNTYNKLYWYDESSDWCPQEKVLKSIISYFNQHFSPRIDIYTLINKSLDDINFVQKEEACLQWYKGTYFCYYLSNSGKYCHYGILKIQNFCDTNYECEAILGFFEQEFDELKSQFNLLEESNKSIKEIYDEYSKNSEYTPFGYYSGEVTLLKDSLVFYLINENHSFSRIITLKRFDRVSTCKRYQGGIGSIMTTSSADKSVVFQNIGLSLVDIENRLEKMKELLKIDVDHVSGVISNKNEDKNKRWFNLVVGRD